MPRSTVEEEYRALEVVGKQFRAMVRGIDDDSNMLGIGAMLRDAIRTLGYTRCTCGDRPVGTSVPIVTVPKSETR